MLANASSLMAHDAIIASTMLQIGDQFDQYQIQEHIARGGMADIYRAYDVVNRREVALKVPDTGMIGDPAQYERFKREIEVTSSLEHPAVLHGLNYGQYNRIPYLATEFVHGKSLREIIEVRAPLPLDEALSLTRHIAEGMAYCHENGVVHRDLKPENILVTTQGKPVIMDFGLALTKGSHRVTYASLSAPSGTPEYMAPEQIEGQRGDPRTDIYALGTMLYEMLAGAPPFSGDNDFAVMAVHLNKPAPRLDHVQPGIPPTVAAIVACCLQRDPADRFADMHTLINALDHPESADLSYLDRAASVVSSPFRSTTFKAVVISIAVIAAMIALALLLQAIRP